MRTQATSHRPPGRSPGEGVVKLLVANKTDLLRVVDRAMHAQFDKAEDGTRFCIVNAMSNNTGMRWSLERGRHLLGYEPQDDVAQHIELDD